MADKATIHYIARKDINTTLWDQCIHHSANGLIYATHEYLDTICVDWDGLVMDDYDMVMPLVWRRKLGIHYLYYPPFCASLGVFGNHLTPFTIGEFLSAIPPKFRYWDFPLNFGNLINLEKFPCTIRSNYILDLGGGYAAISANYRENLRRNIRKSAALQFSVSIDFPVWEVVALARLYTPKAVFAPEIYTRFEKIYTILASRGKAKTYGIRNEKGALLASAVFLFDEKRAYYMLVGNHPDGKTAGASHAMLDAFIKDHAGQQLILDFEGSDIRNLAYFYSGFGASVENYPVIQLNRLPAAVSWLKK